METTQNNYTIIIFSESGAGVLTQVAHVFTRRMLSIDSINASTSSISGIHRYTITTRTDEATIRIVTKQIEKKVDVLQAHYFEQDKVFVMDTGLFKVATNKLMDCPEISKAIRLHNASIIEVNQVYAIVTLSGLSETIVSLHEALKPYDCVLQYVRSGAIAITRCPEEPLEDFLAQREHVRQSLND